MTYNCKALGLVAALALAPMGASAAVVDITIQNFGTGSAVDTANATAALDAFMGSSPITGTEDFEGFTACTGGNVGGCASAPVGSSDLGTTPIQSSSVGNFYGIAPSDQPGGSALNPKDEIIVRSDNPNNTFSRYDVVGGTNWLDSNDLNGIRWEIPGAANLSKILKIAFFLTDVDDVGNVDFKITAVGEDVTVENIFGAHGGVDGSLDLVTMQFDGPIDLTNIQMTTGAGDGFGIDGIQVASVPLPASALLLLGGLGGLGGLSVLRRRKRAA